MRGTLFLVVGPSGAGKDTLIAAARAARPDLIVPRRAATRAADGPGEVVTAMTPRDFEHAEAAGAFALSWRAHGLAYGIPVEAAVALAAGRNVLANVSRSVVETARRRYAPVRVLVVTASPERRAERLAARGREAAPAIATRLARAPGAILEGLDVTVIENEGALAAAEAAFLAALQPARA